LDDIGVFLGYLKHPIQITLKAQYGIRSAHNENIFIFIMLRDYSPAQGDSEQLMKKVATFCYFCSSAHFFEQLFRIKGLERDNKTGNAG
jgi:hypothetical protein